MIHTGVEDTALTVIDAMRAPVAPLAIAIDTRGVCSVVFPDFTKPTPPTLSKRIDASGGICLGYGWQVASKTLSFRFIVPGGHYHALA